MCSMILFTLNNVNPASQYIVHLKKYACTCIKRMAKYRSKLLLNQRMRMEKGN